MRVRDVMTADPVTVRPGDTLRTVQDRMSAHECRRLPVVDLAGQLCGIITDRDVRLALNSPLVMRERWQDDMLLDHTLVDACMTPDPVTTAPDASVSGAIDVLLRHKISGLPVLDGDRIIDLMDWIDETEYVFYDTDIIRAIVELP